MKKVLSALFLAVFASAMLSVLPGGVMARAQEENGVKPPGELLPGSSAIAGWHKDGEELSYKPDNLWEYIDGSAENFLTYDFKEVAAQHYLDDSGREIKVEIYLHSSPLMAFGIYAQFRSPQSNYIDIGNEAFGDDYSLHFWKGPYYVKVNAFDEGEESVAAMKEFARYVEKEIPEAGAPPKEISLFPRNGLIDKSVKYLPEGVLGSSDLPPAFAAEYEYGKSTGKLYIFTMDSEKTARGLFDTYSAKLGLKGAEASDSGLSWMEASGDVQYRGRIVFIQLGKRAGIVTGFKDDQAKAEALGHDAVKAFSDAMSGE